jgi:peroxiredoxin Q/BCP
MEYILVGVLLVSTLLVGGLVLALSGEPPAPGREAPAFDLPGTDGTRHSPAQWRGRRAVVVFFPMDDTPECLALVDRLREAAPRVAAAGCALVAVAVATPAAAKAYAASRDIPFPVLADESGRAAKAWGTLVNLVFLRFSKKLTVIVDPRGCVERLWRDNAGPGHVAEVVDAIAAPAG